MEIDAAVLIFLIFSVSSYLLMRPQLVDTILGFALLSNGINLMLLFTSENPSGKAAPIVSNMPIKDFVDPLPQALILTAIVIGFGLMSYMIVLAFRLYGYHGSAKADIYIKMDDDV